VWGRVSSRDNLADVAKAKKPAKKSGVAAKVAAAKKRAGVTSVNKPKMTPGHPKKKAVVVAKQGDQVKVIRFGDQSMGHNYSPEARKSFKSRHARSIAKGPMSPAYWADRYLWSAGGRKKDPPSSQKNKFGKKGDR